MVWTVAVAAGFVAMVGYSAEPRPVDPPPATWPAGAGIDRDATSPILLVFLHPLCPCSGATATELDRLMTRCSGRLHVVALFYSEPTRGVRWDRGSLYADCARIPGVRLVEDPCGVTARRFGAMTSGSTALYGRDGRLLFYGGITIARGHEGDNAGADAVAAIVDEQPPAVRCTPVYGCGLFDCADEAPR